MSDINWQKDLNFSNYEEALFEPLMEAPKPIIETQMVELAAATEEPKTYIEETPFKEREKEFTMNEPVNIYEPGFREDMADAMLNFFRKRFEEKKRLDGLREKLGLR